ncbi:hypothetical protein AB1Y20_004840 [Prymnesium parvum]|uniref:F-box/LRR-repeat protein 15-like leucin rich repeat domain-containing protein n=1 Tax=Prymnesium parvum TaxID=97485 RepID=A0AB34J1E9_PRYPA
MDAAAHSALSEGSTARIVGLQTRDELNGRTASLESWDAKLSRWKVRVEGVKKLLALHPSNLQSIDEAAAGAAMPEIVSARVPGKRSRVGLIVERRVPEAEVRVEFEGAAKESAWLPEANALSLPPAPEEMVPTEFLYCPVLAREAVPAAGKRKAMVAAEVQDIRIDPSGRLRFWVQWSGQQGGRWALAAELRAAPEETTQASQPEPPAGKKKKAAAAGSEGLQQEAGASTPAEGENKSRSSAKAGGDASSSTCVRSEKAGRKRPMTQPSGALALPEEEDAATGGAQEVGSTGKSNKKRQKEADSSPDAGPSRGDMEAEAALSSNKWSRKNKQANDSWEAALDAMQQREAEPDSEKSAAPAPAAPARDPRMAGFRIGGQGETAEERGEGWCGPWSTAMRLVSQREQAKAEREAAIAAGGTVQPLCEWTPSRDVSTPRPPRPAAIPTLQQLAVSFLVEYIEDVGDFGVLPPGIMHSLASQICARRKFTEQVLPLFTSDASASELILPDLHQVTEGALLEALDRLITPASRLGLVQLDYCGRCLSDAALLRLEPLASLHTLRLTGCYRVSNGAIDRFLRARGGGLHALHLSGSSQLSAETLTAIGANCRALRRLAIEDCAQLPSASLLPLEAVGRRLEGLSFGGVCLLADETLERLARCGAHALESLCLRGCAMLTTAGVVAVAKACLRLQVLDLEGVEMLTDEALFALGEHTPALRHLVLKRCVQVSDAGVSALAAGCRSLQVLSLNNIPALGDLALVALRECCASSLASLDLSWCRGVTDQGVGALVDAAPNLETLSIWGCSQLTKTFFDGHGKDSLQIIGRCFA